MPIFISAAIKRINYYPLHRSGCTLKRDSLVDKARSYDKRIYGPSEYSIQDILLICDLKGIAEPIEASYQLFLVNDEIEYNSYYSLN